MKIRSGKPGDASAAAQIRAAASLAGFSDYISRETLLRLTDPAEYEKRYLYALKDGSLRFLVGYSENKCSAMLSWCQLSDTCGEIVSLHVSPETWGTGFAAAMMDTALDEMKASDLNEVILWTFEKNIRARRFYEKMGFLTEGVKRSSAYDGEPELCYRRKLNK